MRLKACLDNKMTRTINCLFFISFMDLLAVSLIVPLLSAHVKSLGASHTLVGLASSVYGALQFFSGPVAGSWSDIQGRRKMLMLSLFCCSLCYLSLGLASHILLIVFIRVVLGTLKHTQSMCKVILSDVVPIDTQTLILGRYNAISGLGFMIGPVIGGHLVELQHGFFYVCCITCIIFLINSCVTLFFVPKSKQNSKNERQRREISFTGSIMMAVTQLRCMNWSLYWDAFSLKLMLAFSLSMLYANFSLSLQERFNVTPSSVGYMISFQSLLGAVSSFGTGAMRRMYSHGPAKLTQHGFVVLALSFSCIVCCSSLWLFILALAPLAMVTAILRTTLTQWFLDQAPPDQRGSVLGAQHSLSAVSQIPAPAIAGIVHSAFGPKGPCVISLLATLFGIIIATRISENGKKFSTMPAGINKHQD